MAKKIQTFEELYTLFLDSVEVIMKDIETKEKDLKKRKDDDDVTRLHYLNRQLQAWFRSMGNLPIAS